MTTKTLALSQRHSVLGIIQTLQTALHNQQGLEREGGLEGGAGGGHARVRVLQTACKRVGDLAQVRLWGALWLIGG